MNTPTEEKIDLTKYMKDAAGRLCPVETIEEADLARDSLVKEIVAKAEKLNAALRDFRLHAHADIEAFVDLSCEKYGVKPRGKKGNITLHSFDGKYRIQRSIQETLGFDEKLQAAKQLVDECLNEWSKDSGPELRTIITDAFQVDKEGRINTKRIISLRRIKIDHPKWLRAMEAISDSLKVEVSRSYIRVYVRDDNREYQLLALDVANA